MPRISTFLTAITLSLALGLLAVPGNAQAGHKSNGHGKGYERHAAGHHKVKRDDDWDDRKGSHGYRKFDRDDDDRNYRHGHKKRHKKHHKHAHKKHHKYGHKQAHKHGHGHGHHRAKHHHGKRHDHRDVRVNGFRLFQEGFFGRLQAGLHGGDGGCHKVSKIGYRNRQKALIGGTACYDRYGNLYIVEGSRYVIRYLNDDWH